MLYRYDKFVHYGSTDFCVVFGFEKSGQFGFSLQVRTFQTSNRGAAYIAGASRSVGGGWHVRLLPARFRILMISVCLSVSIQQKRQDRQWLPEVDVVTPRSTPLFFPLQELQNLEALLPGLLALQLPQQLHNHTTLPGKTHRVYHLH